MSKPRSANMVNTNKTNMANTNKTNMANMTKSKPKWGET